MCPHTTIYVSAYYYICVLHTTTYVSSYYYICVLILLHVSSYYYTCVVIPLHVSSFDYMRRHTTACVLILLHAQPPVSYTTTCVLILLHMCPHTTTYVSSFYYTCPHSTAYVSSFYYMRSHLINVIIIDPRPLCPFVYLVYGDEFAPFHPPRVSALMSPECRSYTWCMATSSRHSTRLE
jgi:hypothetical protein